MSGGAKLDLYPAGESGGRGSMVGVITPAPALGRRAALGALAVAVGPGTAAGKAGASPPPPPPAAGTCPECRGSPAGLSACSGQAACVSTYDDRPG